MDSSTQEVATDDPKIDATAFNTILAIAAVLIAIRSCSLSADAVNATKASNSIAKSSSAEESRQFLQVNRPCITLRPTKWDNGEYLLFSQDGATVTTKLRYKVRNVGSVTAKDIRYPNVFVPGKGFNLTSGANLRYEKEVEVFSLAPGEWIYQVTVMLIQFDTEADAKLNLTHFNSSNSKGVTLGLPVTYSNPLDPRMNYKTIVEDRITKDTVTLLKSEMLDLPKRD